ncbi:MULTISPECIES: non-ribosomal peptide synthetase [Streptosporangium]|uniref:Amino acid adenylation domain-containing protein n=1 Tax=Streptosporangium brasiliense TaxID=47480 RepID=A0ABT9RFB1_9ACTN|nr:non-ribosomal peptide synthetase [Streptosporangium brasiliense]MDP9867531.1 amino acid adenylation domain-containing protein [Streptosporangium brasiliense]
MRGFDPSGEKAGAHHLFAAWARTAPTRDALVHRGGRMTYAELEERAGALSEELVSAGTRAGDMVGVLTEHSFLLPVVVLAVWKAGAAYVPLPPPHLARRTELVLADTDARLVVSELDPHRILPGHGLRAVRPDGPGRVGRSDAGHTGSDGAAVTGEGDLAYVLYTSGSTGTPKGVMVEHGGVTNLAEGLRSLFGDLEGARVLQFAPFTFDAWVWELSMSLLNGGTLCVPPPGAPLCGPELSRILREFGVTHLSGAPSLLATLPDDEPIPVTTMTSGGEPLPEYLVERWGTRLRLFNAYGPTEATVSATAGRCRPGEGKPSVGRPLSGVEVHILDPAGDPVPDGETGELCVAGRGVARGYANRPELTRERFVPDPFSGRPGARLYRTGDLARRLPGGAVDFMGRIDGQLNIRGYRIEPGEVEAALTCHPRVTGAAVIATGEPGAVRLTAYAQLTAGPPLSSGEVRDFLADLLPAYMIPSVFVTLDRLPLTSHGKVDRGALPSPKVRPRAAGGESLPASVREREVSEVVGRILRLDDIGVEENFFDLGGTSADLVRLQAEVKKRWGVLVPIADLTAAHNVRLLAALLDERDGHGESRAEMPTASRMKLLDGGRRLGERLGKEQTR